MWESKQMFLLLIISIPFLIRGYNSTLIFMPLRVPTTNSVFGVRVFAMMKRGISLLFKAFSFILFHSLLLPSSSWLPLGGCCRRDRNKIKVGVPKIFHRKRQSSSRRNNDGSEVGISLYRVHSSYTIDLHPEVCFDDHVLLSSIQQRRLLVQ